MKRNRIIQQLHDSTLEQLEVDRTLSNLSIKLSNGNPDSRRIWEINIFGLLELRASSQFSLVREYLDIYDVVEIHDEECRLWQNRVVDSGVEDELGTAVHKLLFASVVFGGVHKDEGIVVVCRRFKLRLDS